MLILQQSSMTSMVARQQKAGFVFLIGRLGQPLAPPFLQTQQLLPVQVSTNTHLVGFPSLAAAVVTTSRSRKVEDFRAQRLRSLHGVCAEHRGLL